MNKINTYKLAIWILEDVLEDYEYAKYSLIPTLHDELEEDEMIPLIDAHFQIIWHRWVGLAEESFAIGNRPHLPLVDHNFKELARSLFLDEESYQKEARGDRGVDFVNLLKKQAPQILELQLTKQLTNEEKVLGYAYNNSENFKIGENVIIKNHHDKRRVGNKLCTQISYYLKKVAYRLILEITPESKKTLKMLLKDRNQPDEAILNYTALFNDIQAFATPTEGLMQIKHLMMFCARAYYDKETQQAVLVYDNLREELRKLLDSKPIEAFEPIGLHKNKVMVNAFTLFWQNKEWQTQVEEDALSYIKDFINHYREYKYSPKIGSFDCSSFIEKGVSLDKNIDFRTRYLQMYIVRLFCIGIFHLRESFFKTDKNCLIDAMKFIKQKAKVTEDSLKQDLRLLGLSGTPESDVKVVYVFVPKIHPCEEKWKERIYNEFYEKLKQEDELEDEDE